MANPQNPAEWTLTADANTTVNTVNIAEFAPYANMNNAIREVMSSIRSELAAMSPTVTAAQLITIHDIGQFRPMSGNTTVEGASTAVTGAYREVRVLGTPLLKHNGTSFILPNAVNYQAAADDMLKMRSLGAGNWLVNIAPKSGLPNGKHMLPFLAAGILPATTNGPSLGQTESTTNKVNFRTLDFDATTAESAWFSFPAPTSADEGTLTFEYDWTYAATATGSGVAFSLSVLAVGDGDAIDAAPSTAVTVTDAKLGSGVKHTSAESAAITPAGTWAAGDMLMAKIARVPSDAADLVTADAQLMAVRLFMTTNAAVDTTP